MIRTLLFSIGLYFLLNSSANSLRLNWNSRTAGPKLKHSAVAALILIGVVSMMPASEYVESLTPVMRIFSFSFNAVVIN